MSLLIKPSKIPQNEVTPPRIQAHRGGDLPALPSIFGKIVGEDNPEKADWGRWDRSSCHVFYTTFGQSMQAEENHTKAKAKAKKVEKKIGKENKTKKIAAKNPKPQQEHEPEDSAVMPDDARLYSFTLGVYGSCKCEVYSEKSYIIIVT